MIGFGIFLVFMIVMPFSLAKSAGMAERKFEELEDKEGQKVFWISYIGNMLINKRKRRSSMNKHIEVIGIDYG